MRLINAVFGTASQIDPDELAAEFGPILVDGEEITGAFKVIRDLFVFTQFRLILVDKQGITGRKVEYHSIPSPVPRFKPPGSFWSPQNRLR